MVHPIHRVTGFQVVGPYALLVAFADGTEQRIDFRPVLRGALFGPLQDLTTFNAVSLDPEAGTLVWYNGADFRNGFVQRRCSTSRATCSPRFSRKRWEIAN
jgi:Protein of unknown function (DUF2442)